MEDLNTRLDAWIQTAYHRTPHGGLPPNTTPLQRWGSAISSASVNCHQPPMCVVCSSTVWDRVVRRDSTFLLQKRFYEAPAHLAGQNVEVRFDPLDPSQADVFCGGVFQGAARLTDPVANGLWIAAKSEPAPAPEPTGINYVELLHQKREDGDV